MREEIKSLTGLRGVAACYVILFHFLQLNTLPIRLSIFLHHGYLAVDMFFILNGFVMSATYSTEFAKFSVRIYFRYLWKRLGRVYPLYFVATLSMLAVYNVYDRALPDNINITENLLMVQAWGLGHSIDRPGWSISTEFAAYILFPILLVMKHTERLGEVIVRVLIMCMLLSWVASLSGPVPAGMHKWGPLDLSIETTAFPVLRCLIEFTIGILACHAASLFHAQQRLEESNVTTLVASTVLGLLFFQDTDIAVVVLFSILITLLGVRKSDFVSKCLSFSPVHFLGAISYSMYLVHLLLKEIALEPLQRRLGDMHIAHAYTIGLTMIMFTIVPFSTLSFYGFEKPLRNLSRKMIHSKPLSIDNEPSAP